MQTAVVNSSILVREPDIEGFFALTKEMVEESESHTCGVWLIDESGQRCELWMVYAKDRLYTPHKDDWGDSVDPAKRCACHKLADHLFEYKPGWNATVEYRSDDERLPEAFRAFVKRMDSASLIATPLVLGGGNLRWMTVSSPGTPSPTPVVARRAHRSCRASGGAHAPPQPPARIQPSRGTPQSDSRRAQSAGA
jgi:hypothetical protein